MLMAKFGVLFSSMAQAIADRVLTGPSASWEIFVAGSRGGTSGPIQHWATCRCDFGELSLIVPFAAALRCQIAPRIRRLVDPALEPCRSDKDCITDACGLNELRQEASSI